jgi:uncharacterized membrane protein
MLCVALLLPCLSAFSALYDSRDGLLLVYLLAGATIFTVRVKFSETDGDRFFPLILASATLSLLLSGTLNSVNLSGNDIHQEFALFQQVLQGGVWHPEISLTYNSALSVTILPTMISLICSFDGTLLLKTVYPLIYSIVPIILYRIYRMMMAPTAAAISVFVFLSYPASYLEIGQLARQMIAELLMVLLFWLLLSSGFRKSRAARTSLVIVTTIGLIMSHYSLGLICIYLIGISFIARRILGLKSRMEQSTNAFALSIVAAIAWYFFVAGGSVLQEVTGMSSFVTEGFSNFFNPASRPPAFLDALGLTSAPASPLHAINRFTQYLVLFCIVLGFVIYVRTKPRTTIAETIIPLMVGSMGLLIAAVALPYFSTTLNLSRIYQLALLFISPCFYFGGAKIVSCLRWLCALLTRKHIRIRAETSILAAILFSYLLFTSGWVWAITLDTPDSVVLDMGRIANSSDRYLITHYYRYYTLTEDVAAARWIRSYGSADQSVCGDFISRTQVLNSYGGYEREGPILPICLYYIQRYYLYLGVMGSIRGVGVGASKYGLFMWQVNFTSLQTENRIYSDEATIYEFH